MQAYNSKKYIISSSQMDFASARAYCSEVGADLVSITEQGDLEWLQKQLFWGEWYMGLYSVTYDGDIVSFWSSGAEAESASIGKPCVLVNGTKMVSSDCMRDAYVICQLRSNKRPTPYLYWLEEEPRQAHNAKQRCEELGGDLAWITSEKENNQLGVFISSRHPEMTSWLLGYRGRSSDFSCWHGNYTCGYQNLRRSLSPDTTDLCVSMSTRKFFQWEESACDEPLPSVCKVYFEHSRYYLRGMYRYFAVVAPMNYTRASGFCNGLGGDLVWFENQAEHEWFASVLSAHHADVAYWYIGLFDQVGKNYGHNYQWLGGYKRKFTNFASGEPGKAEESCVTMERPLGYKWADVECGREEPFACKAFAKTKRHADAIFL
jgi:hypothetical protein